MLRHAVLLSWEAFCRRFDERRGCVGVDCISEKAQLRNSRGNLISHPANSGWRERPPFSIGTFEDLATADTCDGSGQPPAPKIMFGPPFAPSEARSADQTATTTFCNVTVAFDPSGRRPVSDVPGGFFCPPLGVVAAGHKEIAIPELIPTSARGFDWDRPHGVVHGFQITAHKGDPRSPSRNLFSKDCCRASLGDKFSPNRPEMTGVGEPKLPTGNTPRLAGATPAPH